MRLLIQRVSKASVTRLQSNEVVGSIEKGLFILLGVKNGDTIDNANQLAEKLVKLRVMADENDKMNLAAENFLIVSQFTLYASTKDGNRPSFIDAAAPEDAKKIYEHFIAKVKDLGGKVETGSFGDYMKINTELDGPVTIILES